MHMNDRSPEPPRLAAKYWDEYSSKQTLLSTFFGKRSSVSLPPDPSPPPPSNNTIDSSTPPLLGSSQISDPPTQPASLNEAPPPSSSPLPSLSSSQVASDPPSLSVNQLLSKRKSDTTDSPRGKLKKQKSGQSKLSSFFVKPGAPSKAASNGKTAMITSATAESVDMTENVSSKQNERLYAAGEAATSGGDQESDHPVPAEPSQSSLVQSSSASKVVWSQLLAPIKPPRCSVHGEPAKEYTVNKPGPNKGKTFFICSRCVASPE